MSKLEVCERCGWHVVFGLGSHHEDCEQRGAYAKELREAIPNVSSTQLGYGHGFVTFEHDENFHVRIRVRASKRALQPFQLEEVWLLDDLSHDDAIDLIKTLVAWRERCATRGLVASVASKQLVTMSPSSDVGIHVEFVMPLASRLASSESEPIEAFTTGPDSDDPDSDGSG